MSWRTILPVIRFGMFTFDDPSARHKFLILVVDIAYGICCGIRFFSLIQLETCHVSLVIIVTNISDITTIVDDIITITNGIIAKTNLFGSFRIPFETIITHRRIARLARDHGIEIAGRNRP